MFRARHCWETISCHINFCASWSIETGISFGRGVQLICKWYLQQEIQLHFKWYIQKLSSSCSSQTTAILLWMPVAILFTYNDKAFEWDTLIKVIYPSIYTLTTATYQTGYGTHAGASIWPYDLIWDHSCLCYEIIHFCQDTIGLRHRLHTTT